MKDEWGGGWGPKMTVTNSRATQKSSLQSSPCFCPRMVKERGFLFSLLLPCAPDTDCDESVFFTVYGSRTWGGPGGREGAEQVEGLESSRTGIELLSAQTMARYGPCILRNWMMKEGPPATICGGRWLRGQFSMLMMDSLLQRASSNGRLCRLGLSLRYSSSRFSSVPEDRRHVVSVKISTLPETSEVYNSTDYRSIKRYTTFLTVF